MCVATRVMDVPLFHVTSFCHLQAVMGHFDLVETQLETPLCLCYCINTSQLNKHEEQMYRGART